MDTLSEGYCSDTAVWFDDRLRPRINIAEVCYGESQISPEANRVDWLRVISLPIGYLVDASHQTRIRDDEGKFKEAVPFLTEKPVGAVPRLLKGFVETSLQLEAVEEILKTQFGMHLSGSILHSLAEGPVTD